MSSISEPSAFDNQSSRSLSYYQSVFVLSVISSYKAVICSSKDFYSFESTLLNNCYSRPPYVTVKSIIVVLAASSGENFGFDNLVVMNNEKLISKSILSSPPKSSKKPQGFLINYFSRIGSNIGSTSFSIPSINTGHPF